jgi:hypothetical protein
VVLIGIGYIIGFLSVMMFRAFMEDGPDVEADDFFVSISAEQRDAMDAILDQEQGHMLRLLIARSESCLDGVDGGDGDAN